MRKNKIYSNTSFPIYQELRSWFMNWRQTQMGEERFLGSSVSKSYGTGNQFYKHILFVKIIFSVCPMVYPCSNNGSCGFILTSFTRNKFWSSDLKTQINDLQIKDKLDMYFIQRPSIADVFTNFVQLKGEWYFLNSSRN